MSADGARVIALAFHVETAPANAEVQVAMSVDSGDRHPSGAEWIGMIAAMIDVLAQSSGVPYAEAAEWVTAGARPGEHVGSSVVPG